MGFFLRVESEKAIAAEAKACVGMVMFLMQSEIESSSGCRTTGDVCDHRLPLWTMSGHLQDRSGTQSVWDDCLDSFIYLNRGLPLALELGILPVRMMFFRASLLST